MEKFGFTRMTDKIGSISVCICVLCIRLMMMMMMMMMARLIESSRPNRNGWQRQRLVHFAL